MFLILTISCEPENREFENPGVYNKEVDKGILKTYFPKQINNSFSISGNSSLINVKCPLVSLGDKYIVVNYDLKDEINPDDIAVLNVFIEKKEFTDNKVLWHAVADKYYLPQNLNTIRVKNYFSEGEYKLWYGFFLKKDSLEPYPRLHKVTCNLQIE